MLYALQTASVNLRHARFEADDATDVVIDRDDVHRTSLGGPQWFEEDFEDESEEESEAEDDVTEDDATEDDVTEDDAAPEDAIAASPNKAPQVKHVSLEEARMQVRGVVRDWLLETAAEEAAGTPG